MIGDEQTNGYRDPDTFDVRASLRSISEAAKHHKALVFLTCFITLALLTGYIYLWPPLYAAEATMMAERDGDIARDAFYLNWAVFRKDDVRTEIELMTAGPVLKEVIEKQKLTYDDVYHPFMSHLSYMWEKSSVGKFYRRIKARMFPPDPNLPDPKDLELGRILVDMRAGIKVEPVGESSIGKLTVKGPSRRVAAIANTLLDVYLASRTDRHRGEAQRSYDVLENQVAVADKELKAVEAQRLAFTKANLLAFDFQLEGLEMNKLAELEGNIATGRTRISILEASLKALDQQLVGEPATQTTTSVSQLNALRENLKMRRLELESSLALTRDRYRDDSPEVQDIKNDLAKLDGLMTGETERVEAATTTGVNAVHQDLVSKRDALVSDLAGSRAGQLVMEQTDRDMRSRLSLVPDLQTQLRAVDRELGAAGEKYQQLEQKRAQAAVALATTKSTIPSVQVVDYATPPADKYWPKTKILYPAGLVVGLILGVLVAMIRSTTDGRIRREHVEHGRGAVPLYFSLNVGSKGRSFTVEPRESVTGPSSGRPSA